MRILFLILFSSAFISCFNSSIVNTVSSSGFESSEQIETLTIEHIIVKETNEKEIPINPTVLKIYELDTKGDFNSNFPGSSMYHDRKYDYEWVPQKMVHFNKKMKYYFWREKFSRSEHDILPIKITKNNWYRISNYPRRLGFGVGAEYHYIYFHILENGELKKNYHTDYGGPAKKTFTVTPE